MRAAKRSAAVLPPALKPSFKAHQDHVEHVIDVLVDIIILYPDNLMTFSLEKTSRLRSYAISRSSECVAPSTSAMSRASRRRRLVHSLASAGVSAPRSERARRICRRGEKDIMAC